MLTYNMFMPRPSLSLCLFYDTVIKSPHTGYLVSPAKTFYGRDTA